MTESQLNNPLNGSTTDNSVNEGRLDQSGEHSAVKIFAASVAALFAAAVVLVVAVLPAEYGWDPLGSGEALGLMGLSGEEVSALASQSKPWVSDSIEFQLAPFEAVEYKYRLEQGAAMVYSWSAEGDVVFEMHSEPDGAAPSFAETFSAGRSPQQSGVYNAPFPGIHGWFWQNRTSKDLTVRLNSSGFFSYAIEFRGGHEYRRKFGKPATEPSSQIISGD